jgi:hypothetical protein
LVFRVLAAGRTPSRAIHFVRQKGALRMRPFLIRFLTLCLLVCALPPVITGQQKKGGAPSSELFRDVPSALHSHAAALGDRVLVAGKERSVLAGQFADDSGKRVVVRLTLQLPALFILEGLNPGDPPITFDGETRKHRQSRGEESLVETFSSDTTEGMFASVKDGAAVQMIARRVDSDPTRERGKSSTLYDIFEVSAPVRSSATYLERLKRYVFDSQTGLLASTQYLDEMSSPPMAVETRFSDWRQVEGSAYPGRIERLENGRTVFSLSVHAIEAAPRQDPASFR